MAMKAGLVLLVVLIGLFFVYNFPVSHPSFNQIYQAVDTETRQSLLTLIINEDVDSVYVVGSSLGGYFGQYRVARELSNMLKTTYPAADVKSLGPVGHFPYLNVPLRYNRVMRDFFDLS